MRYLITTLAVGDEYIDTALYAFKKYMENTIYADFAISSDHEFITSDNITYNHISTPFGYSTTKPFPCQFFFNLKVLALKCAVDKDYDYIIYHDADWYPTDKFNEQGLFNLFEFMELNNYDMLCERPNTIGAAKHSSECFYSEKIKDYRVLEHTKWDEANCFNEQFLVFKNSWKFRFFVMRWEQFLWYTIHNDIINYAEGFEIGVSALEAEMNICWNGWGYNVTEMFGFKTKYEKTEHLRFW